MIDRARMPTAHIMIPGFVRSLGTFISLLWRGEDLPNNAECGVTSQ